MTMMQDEEDPGVPPLLDGDEPVKTHEQVCMLRSVCNSTSKVDADQWCTRAPLCDVRRRAEPVKNGNYARSGVQDKDKKWTQMMWK